MNRKKQDRVEVLSVVRDDTSIRNILALVFIGTFAFFLLSSILLGGASIFVSLDGKVGQAKEIIVTISSIFSGPLGIVIGYYFRSQMDRDKTTP